MAFGPEAALELLDDAGEEPALHELPPAAGGAATCSRKLGRGDEARAEFERAAELSANQRQAHFLRRRAAAC